MQAKIKNGFFLLHISKLNRTFGFSEGTPLWICKIKNEFFLLHISKLNRTFARDLYIKVHDFCRRVYTI